MGRFLHVGVFLPLYTANIYRYSRNYECVIMQVTKGVLILAALSENAPKVFGGRALPGPARKG